MLRILRASLLRQLLQPDNRSTGHPWGEPEPSADIHPQAQEV